jgi:hypothetical protein
VTITDYTLAFQTAVILTMLVINQRQNRQLMLCLRREYRAQQLLSAIVHTSSTSSDNGSHGIVEEKILELNEEMDKQLRLGVFERVPRRIEDPWKR